ncbi:hypothetical protein [Bartonella sp. DGB2]|uniref:hypothetical protein n=1 Tax=Bartonella sp. DGB2 TaxID=3388426 RepID=UPI00398FC249
MSGLKTIFLPENPDFGGVTLLGLKIRMGDNCLSRSSRLFNCIVTRKLSLLAEET